MEPSGTGAVRMDDEVLGSAQNCLVARPDQALALLAPLLERRPVNPGARRLAANAHWRLAQMLASAGNLRDAAREHRHATVLEPAAPETWIGLADVLGRLGDLAGAEEAYLRSVQVAVNEPQMAQAAAHLANDRLPQAESILRSRLRTFPTDVAAIRMLGELAGRLGRRDDAAVLLRRCLELAPGFNRARELLARLLGRWDAGEALLEIAELVRREPGNPSHRMYQASLLAKTGDQEGARIIYEGLLATAADQPSIWLGLGHVLKTLGRQEDAIAAYRSAIELQATLGEAWWSIANLKTFHFSADDQAAMNDALKSADQDEDIWHLHYALGKALENDGQAQDAFEHYAAGARLRRRHLDYSADDTEDQCRRWSRVFDTRLLHDRRGQGCSAADPIFIIGLPRAGSTLVEQILSSHSQVEGTMELPDMMSIAARLRAGADGDRGETYPERLASLPLEALRALGEEYLERTRIQRKTARPLFIDKMPNNWQHVGLIQLILPNAKIIDARRHPMACGFSAWTQHFATGQAFSYDLQEVGRYYRDYVYLMEAFERAAPGRIHRVIYERMVEDTETEVRSLLAYLDLPFEEACLSFWRTSRAVRTASSEQVRRPIFKSGLDHWKDYEPWLKPLADVVGPLVDAYPAVPSGGVRPGSGRPGILPELY